MQFDVWYKFKNRMDKEDFLRKAIDDYGCKYEEVMMNAEALMIRKYDGGYAIRYRTKIDERYMNIVRLYKGDQGMECVNECARDVAYPIREYFNKRMKCIDADKKVAMQDALKELTIYKNARAFANCAKRMGNPYLDPFEMVMSLHLSDDIKEKLNNIEAQYDVMKNELSAQCRLAENLVRQCDTYEQRLAVYKKFINLEI